MRILVVDDHEEVRHGVLSFLRTRPNFDVCGEAIDGEDAVQKAKELRPDVVLMDVNMPKLNGLNATREIHKALPDTQVLIVSQHDSAELRREALSAGARDYLDKSSLSTELKAALEQIECGKGANRLESEAAAVESENLFRQIIEALPTAVYTTDLEGRLTHFNQAAVRFSGRVPELGTDRWCVTWRLYKGDGTPMPHDQCPMAVLLKEGRIVDGVECLAERPDGTRRWFIPFPRPLRDKNGDLVGGMNMLLDITQRKMNEQANNLLAAIVDSSDDAIVSKNLDGFITSWNKSAERIFGYTAKEAIGQHITLIIPQERREEETDIISRIRAGERVDHFETVRRRKDGNEIDVSLTISPVRDAAGHVVGASKVARDITQQKRAEQALRDSEERFRSIVETTPECVKVVAADGEILHINTSGLTMLGAENSRDVVGKSFYDFIVPEHREKFQAFNERICSGERNSLEFNVIGLNGTRRNMETHAAPLRNPDGSIVHLGVTRDVTERKQAEEMLRQHRKRFDIVAEATEVGFWFCDLPFDKLRWDRRVKEHFWLAADAEVTIDTFYEQLHPDDRERTRKTIAESIAKAEPYDIEYRTVAPDGREKWIRAIGHTFYDTMGRPKSFDGLTFDITQRKEAEKRERQIMAETVAAKAKFQALFEQTTVFAGIMTKDGVLLEANRLSLEACGYRAEDQLGKPFWETGWWRNSPKAQAKIREATPRVANGMPYREMLNYSWADGTERLVDFALYPIVDDKGEILFLHPTGIDITDLKRAEEDYRTLADNISQFAWMADSAGKVFWYNRRWSDYTGLTLKEMQGGGRDRVLHPDYLEAVPRKFECKVKAGEVWEDTFPLRGKDGKYRWFLSRAIPIRDANGKITRWFGTNTDITELREVEEALRKSKDFTEEQVRQRTEELEARNADVLRQSEQLRQLSRSLLHAQDEERRRIARDLHDSTGQLLAALQLNLTLLSKAQPAMKEEPSKHLAAAIELTDQSIKEIRTTSYLLHPPLLDEMGLAGALQWYTHGLTERSGLDIDLNVRDDVGRFSPEIELVIFRIVQECLTNVHRHSQSKRAVIRLVRSNGNVMVEIADAGKGMSAEKLAQVQSQGSGVGIRGMQERVRQFRGTMDIKSDDSGTKVTVTLPAPPEKRAGAVSNEVPEFASIERVKQSA